MNALTIESYEHEQPKAQVMPSLQQSKKKNHK